MYISIGSFLGLACLWYGAGWLGKFLGEVLDHKMPTPPPKPKVPYWSTLRGKICIPIAILIILFLVFVMLRSMTMANE